MNVKIYDTTFLLKMTKEQKKKLMLRAKGLGISASEVIRQMIGLK